MKHKKVLVSRRDQPDAGMFIGEICDVEDSYRHTRAATLESRVAGLIQTPSGCCDGFECSVE